MTINDRLDLCRALTSLKSYRPRRRKAKRRFTNQRRRIVKQLKRAA